MLTPIETERQLPEAPRQFKDDTRFALGRIVVFQYLAVAVFLLLISGFWILQVRDHAANDELAERNRIKTVPLLAPRGKMLDRDGRVIVDNHLAWEVRLSRENLRPEHIDAIAAGLHLDPDDIRAKLRRFASRPSYVPITIKQELTPGELAFVEAHRDAQSFPELELIQHEGRLYPRNGFAAHVIGYVGEVSEDELDSPEFAKYSQGDVVGKFGLERQYNDTLIGIDGEKRVVVDSMGRERQVLDDLEPTPGHNLQLTLDLDLQSVAELGMEGRRGAVVALDPRNGDVLAMVSRPAFDPNLFATRISVDDWKNLTSDPGNPLMNRAIQAQFAPGSTFKPIVALAGLETGSITDDYTVHCGGGATFYGRYFKCWWKPGHGAVSLHNGIVHSCDVYFYNVGNRTGIDNIAKYADLVGYGHKTGIDLPGEMEGVVPSTKWKLRNFREKWYAGETISVAIGQGALTVTPIQLASAIGGLAMHGVFYKPHLVKGADTGAPRRVDLNPDNVDKIVSGMYGVVNEAGTGASAAIPGISVCGKTGSAQRVSNELAKSGKVGAELSKDNAWFVAFAPCENPEIVVVSLWENAVHGNYAAPIARDVIKAYFDKKARLAMPKPGQMALFLH
ncbi:MAG TPA: penicillin-binding protein 2 [Bryobacteraceae bacterium]|jgi:penicillin-binding protein 2|nr:penicillin-binding protein 2 [Bryobacteraceae bacterium]